MLVGAGQPALLERARIGQRVCALAEKMAIQPPAQQWIEIADVIAATGVMAGETLSRHSACGREIGVASAVAMRREADIIVRVQAPII